MIEKKNYLPGFTFRSVFVAIFCMLLMGMFIEHTDIILSLGIAGCISEFAFPVETMGIILALTFLVGIVALVTRYKFLTKPEMLCIFFSMLLAAPLMSQGFWHRVIGVTTTIPKQQQFQWIDALSDNLWPHGDNVIPNLFNKENALKAGLTEKGNVSWQKTEYELKKFAVLPVLTNQKKNEVSSVRISIPLKKNGKKVLVPGEEHLVTWLVRSKDLTPESFYYCRFFSDTLSQYQQIFSGNASPDKNFLHMTGFVRVGTYGVSFNSRTKDSLVAEFGLSGSGSIEMYDPKIMNVAAIETMYKGKHFVLESEYSKMPPDKQVGVIVKPDNLWSVKGLKFLLTGYIPVASWVRPVVTWASIVLLIVLGMLAINVVMRKQWAENERYPFPMARVSHALFDNNVKPDSPWASVWLNKIMWMGFAVAMIWGSLKGLHFYYPSIPDTSINFPLKPYFTDPMWGKMWDSANAHIWIVFVSLCLFMELNILISIVIGYFMAISLNMVGQVTGLRVLSDRFPWGDQQAVGAYLFYGLATLFFVRKYLFTVLKDALKGNKESSSGEIFSYRTALIILALSFIGTAVWASSNNMSVAGILFYFFFLLMVGLVASKVRAEVGTPWGYFVPTNAMFFVAILGGMQTFGAPGMLFCMISTFLLTVTVFFVIPGTQLELMEMGRRYNVLPRHILYACIFGAIGGMIVGGWVILSNAYALGANSLKYQWAFDSKVWFFADFASNLNVATQQALGGLVGKKAAFDPSIFGFIYGGVVTVVLVFLRQIFAGFWFHPLGFVLGNTNFVGQYVWANAFVAWGIRFAVLKVGGAATVRNKLMPFAMGLFLGSVVCMIIFWVVAGFVYQHGGLIWYNDYP